MTKDEIIEIIKEEMNGWKTDDVFERIGYVALKDLLRKIESI